MSRNVSAESIQSYQGLPVLDETPPSSLQRQRSADGSLSVVLNIDSSNSSTSSNEETYNEATLAQAPNIQPDNNEDDAEEEVLHCDDWEVRMLAAELNRRESQQHEAALAAAHSHRCSSSGSGMGLMEDQHGRHLRRRRRKAVNAASLESDSNHSEPDRQHHLPNHPHHQHHHHHSKDQQRPRAASLDQHNMQLQRRRRSNPVCKAMSFDRDKDRL